MAAPTFGAVGAYGLETADTSLSLVAPACTGAAGEVFLAQIFFRDGTTTYTATPDDGRWTTKVDEQNSYLGGAKQRLYVFWLRPAAWDSGATFTFTLGPSAMGGLDTCIGIISRWDGCKTGDPFSGVAASVSINTALSETIAFTSLTPGATSLVVAIAGHTKEEGVAGAIAGTDPTFTNRWAASDLAPSGTIFGYSGGSTGAATGARSFLCGEPTGISIGVLLALFEQTIPGELETSPACRYIATIEGVANATGQAKYCYPSLPSYATAAYNTGLAEPPSGGPSQWAIERHKITVGTFRLGFRPGVGPIELMTIRPPAITELTEAIDISETAWDHARTNTQAGIAADSIIYCDRETVKVTAATGGSTTITTLTRAWGGSTAQTHKTLSDLFLSPPTLVGRLVTVYEVPGDATSSGEEVVIMRGYVAGPPAAGLHWATIECVERFERGVLNDTPQGLAYAFRRLAGGASELTLFERLAGAGGTLGLPRGGAGAGGYWYLPDFEAVVEGAYDSSSGQWTYTNRAFVGNTPTLEEAPVGDLLGYPILFADSRQLYASFGYTPDGGSFTVSDNPAVIALNILLSLNATNYTGGESNYDLGGGIAGGIYPEFALGVPVAQVNVAAFERAAFVDLAGVHARHFWLGGNRSETLADVLYRLLAPWGYAVGTTRDGVWTVLRLRDVYPTDTTVAITSQHIAWTRINEVRIQAIGRALDRVVLECNPTPAGEGRIPQTVEEVEGRSWYPRHTGGEERFRDCPYEAADFDIGGDGNTRSHVYDLIANRVELLAGQVPIVRVPLNTTLFGQIDVDTEVTILDVALRDPTTGARMAASATGLKGLCTHVAPDWRTRTALVTIALTNTPANVATMSPSAKVVSWDGGPKTATVESHEVTAADATTDARRFGVGERVALVDSRFVLRSDNGLAQTLPVVSSVTDTTIDLDVDFKDTGGATVTPAAGNWIVFATYDACITAQKTEHGFDADGGDPAVGNNPPDLGAGNAAPYRIGN